MDFTFSEEQTLLKQSISDFIKNEYDFAERTKIAQSEEGFSRKHLKTFADLDWNSVPFSESDGGYGGTAVDIMAIMEEFGKGIVIEPYFSSVIFAGGFFRHGANTEQKAAHIPLILQGKRLYAVAFSEPQSRYDLCDVQTSATPQGSDYVLQGEKIFVLGGAAAETLIVTARTAGNARDEGGISLFMVDANTPGIHKESFTTIDSFRAAHIKFDQVKVSAANLIGEEGGGLAILQQVVQESIVALGAEAVGALEFLYKATVAYSKIRVQFDQPIGKFQSLQMIMSEMFIEYVQVKSMLYMAALKVDSKDEAEKAVAAFKAHLGKAIRFIGQNAIQIHGGIGMTDELNVGHYFKRITMINAMFGDDTFYMDRYIKLSYPMQA